MSEAVTISRGLMNGTADALFGLSLDVEGLGEALCADPAVAERFMDQLQMVDLIAQTLEQLAQVLSAQAPEEAIQQVRVADLQTLLQNSAHALP